MPARVSYRPAPGSIPEQPGVYRFSDETGRVIYVGKAKSLRSRLNSYFGEPMGLHHRTRTMVQSAAKVEWTVVQTETEALQLEYSWIKEFDPRFNVKYRDDKSYPWLCVTMSEEFPRVMVGRGAKRKGNRYFGPYSHAWAIRETVDLLLRVFPMRSCRPGVFKNHKQIGRPCLLGYIGKCVAPCVGRVDADEHRAIVEDFCSFMASDGTAYVKRLEAEMRRASDELEFEKAARLRDDIGALQKAMDRNAIVLQDRTDADVIALAEDPLEVAVQIFHVRGGRVRGERGWVADRMDDGGTGSLIESFLVQLYDEVDPADPDPIAVPREILVPELPTSLESVTEMLTTKRGSRVQIRVPQRGDKRVLMETVARNAGEALIRHKTSRAGDLSTRNRALEEIQEALELPTAPLRIECYDISNLQGTEVVASMVVFEDGLPRKSEYRRFIIRSVDGQNDVAAMHEVISRRFQRLLDDQQRHAPRHGSGGTDSGPAADRPDHRCAAQVRVRAGVGRGGRWTAPGRRRGGRDGRAGDPRRRPLRTGQAVGGGLAARQRRTGDPAPDQRRALPLAAGTRRGAPVRHHPPPVAAQQVDGGVAAGRRPGAGGGPPQDAARALRLAEEAARGDRGGDRCGAGLRSGPGLSDQAAAGQGSDPGGGQHGYRRDRLDLTG